MEAHLFMYWAESWRIMVGVCVGRWEGSELALDENVYMLVVCWALPPIYKDTSRGSSRWGNILRAIQQVWSVDVLRRLCLIRSTSSRPVSRWTLFITSHFSLVLYPSPELSECLHVTTQGDLEHSTYRGFLHSARTLYKQQGISRFGSGLVWRTINIIGTVWICNECMNFLPALLFGE